MPNHDDGDMTMNELERQQQELLSLEGYLALDEEVRRESEVVEGHLVAREPRDRPHQKTAFRLANAFEAAVLSTGPRTPVGARHVTRSTPRCRSGCGTSR